MTCGGYRIAKTRNTTPEELHDFIASLTPGNTTSDSTTSSTPNEEPTSVLNLIGYIRRLYAYAYDYVITSYVITVEVYSLWSLYSIKRKGEKEKKKRRKEEKKKRRKEEKKIRREESVSMVMLCYHYRDSSLCRYVLQQLRFVME